MRKLFLVLPLILCGCVTSAPEPTKPINPACIGQGDGNKFSPIHTVSVLHVLKDGIIISGAETHQGSFGMNAFIKISGASGNLVDGQEVPVQPNACLTKTGTYQYKAKSTDAHPRTVERWEMTNRYLDEPKAE
jgi:hypothetical protein